MPSAIWPWSAAIRPAVEPSEEAPPLLIVMLGAATVG
jgi:hypothetical protein